MVDKVPSKLKLVLPVEEPEVLPKLGSLSLNLNLNLNGKKKKKGKNLYKKVLNRLRRELGSSL